MKVFDENIPGFLSYSDLYGINNTRRLISVLYIEMISDLKK